MNNETDNKNSDNGFIYDHTVNLNNKEENKCTDEKCTCVVFKEQLADAIIKDFHENLNDFIFGYMDLEDEHRDKIYDSIDDIVFNFSSKLTDDQNVKNHDKKWKFLVNLLKSYKFNDKQIQLTFMFVGRLEQIATCMGYDGRFIRIIDIYNNVDKDY